MTMTGQQDGHPPVKPLDPVTLAVVNGRLVGIADEMDATLYRSAFNPIIAETHDACHGLYHAETGATLVQGTSGLPNRCLLLDACSNGGSVSWAKQAR